MHLVYRKSCRVCGSTSLKKVIDLGEQHLQGSFVKPGKELPPMRKIPCELLRCDPTEDENACGLLQMSISVPPSIMYSAYWYRSGTNQTMRDHLKGIASSAQELLGQQSARVLDIGCNDGTLLKNYPDSYIKFGVDPSDVAQTVASDVQVVQDLFPSKELQVITDGEKFDIITSIAMFYDLEDPVGFAASIRDNLNPDGIWVFEMSYMPSMLKMNSYDTICHEHLEYYSLAVLEKILAKAEMKIFKTSLNDINGGSIRCYATHDSCLKYNASDSIAKMNALRQTEFDLALDSNVPYVRFQEGANLHKEKLLQLLLDLKAEGKKIHIYGASTKGNTILQWCGINSSIVECAAERNPDKYGARTLGTNIPIVSEEESRAMKPDYYLVLPWHFKEEFVQREKEILEEGTKFIFPLPEVEIVGIEDI